MSVTDFSTIPTNDELSEALAEQITPVFGPVFGMDNSLTLPALESSLVSDSDRGELLKRLSGYVSRRLAKELAQKTEQAQLEIVSSDRP